MKTSNIGKNLIKQYEGLRLTAYKPVKTEKYWTIGYGHYGPDVTEGMTITQAQADAYLDQDIQTAEKAVASYDGLYHWTQGEWDGLVSFTFNCGTGNFKKLINNGKRTKEEISEAILRYNKAGGRELPGLTRRRKEEQALFTDTVTKKDRPMLRKGDKGSYVRDLQLALNKKGYGLKVDGIFGEKTRLAVVDLQTKENIYPDGIVGPKTYRFLF